MIEIDREQLAWAAGFIDGDGYIGYSGRPVLAATQSGSPEILERLRDVLSLGNVSGPFRQKAPGRQPSYAFGVYSFERVQAAIAMLWPWLGTARREQVRSVLKQCAMGPGKGGAQSAKTHCPAGHPYSAENTYVARSNGHRRCRTCVLAQGRKKYREAVRRRE